MGVRQHDTPASRTDCPVHAPRPPRSCVETFSLPPHGQAASVHLWVFSGIVRCALWSLCVLVACRTPLFRPRGKREQEELVARLAGASAMDLPNTERVEGNTANVEGRGPCPNDFLWCTDGVCTGPDANEGVAFYWDPRDDRITGLRPQEQWVDEGKR